MNALIENFHLLAAAPNGVAKLRELIFELAAQGKLVEEDRDQPAKLVKLGNIAEFVMGQAPPGSECNTNGVGTVFVKTGEFGVLYPEVREWTTKPLKFAKQGDVLICVVGATVGKLNMAIDCAIGRSVAAIRPTSQLDTKYLYFALMPFTLRLRAQSRGSAQGVIGKSELNAVQIRYPSKDEQQRIVAKVDELMQLCDQLEAQQTTQGEAHERLVAALLESLTQSSDAQAFADNWARLAEHFELLFDTPDSIAKLKQTILQLAVRGKLVPQDQHDEPASELLKKIAAEKSRLLKEGKIKKVKPLPEIAEDEKPYELPQGWEWVRFGEITEVRSELVKPDDYLDLPQVAPDCIEKATGRLIAHRTVRAAGVKGPNQRFYAGQLLYSKIRPSLSKAVIVDFDGLCSADMYPLESSINMNFLLYQILSETFLSQVRIAENRIKMPKLNQESLAQFIFALPPIAQQQRIVAKVDELMRVCDALYVRLAHSRELSARLMATVATQGV